MSLEAFGHFTGICYGLKRLLARAHLLFVRVRRAKRVHNYDFYTADYVKQSFVPCPEDEAAERLRPLAEPEVTQGALSCSLLHDCLNSLPTAQGKTFAPVVNSRCDFLFKMGLFSSTTGINL